MRNMGNIAGNVDDLRARREAKNNPPSYEQGQGDSVDWGFFDSDESSGTMEESSFYGTGGASSPDNFSFSSTPMSSNNSWGSIQTQQNPMMDNKTTEDKLADLGILVGYNIFDGLKALFFTVKKGFEMSDAYFWSVFGRKLKDSGIIIAGIGAVMFILSLVTDYFSGAFDVIIGGALTTAVGLIIFSLNFEEGNNIMNNSVQEEPVQEYTPEPEPETDWGSDTGDDDDIDWSGWGLDDEEESADDNTWGNDIESVWGNFDDVEEVIPEDVNIDEAIGSIRDIPAHTQTRQYLFEEMNRVLPKRTPGFAVLKPVYSDSDNFLIFDKILEDASLQVGLKEDNIPELLELHENNFIIQLKASRPIGAKNKEKEIADEIANIYSRDDYGSVTHEGVYATVSSVGSNFIINIFKGEDSLITLADTYTEVKDYILDTSVGKPIVFGLNELGKVWKFNADDVFSFIISGKPRSGKSWAVVSLVLQLCMYSSPKEVTFEVFDVKGTSSDYYKMNEYIPHFKRFESKKKAILSRLKYITTVEADRRKKILKDNDTIAIADLKRRGVNVDIPYLYVIIDEIVGLTSTFTKEESNEFRDLVNILVTQMPNLGIKLIFVPHRVTDDIIPKNSYVNVGFFACVRSEESEIKNVLGATKRDFPYDLSNKGDMALKAGEINKGKVVFCHGIAVTDSNENNEGIYRFIGSLWNRLEPEDTVISSQVNKVEESYKGHELQGIDDILFDESFLFSEEDSKEASDFVEGIIGKHNSVDDNFEDDSDDSFWKGMWEDK